MLTPPLRLPRPLRLDLARLVLPLSFVAPSALVLIAVACPWVVERPRYLALYVAPAVLLFLLWSHDRLSRSEGYGKARATLDVAALLLCGLRMVGPLVPPSGHMLFFVYAGLTMAAASSRWIAVALILETSYLKLAVWRDFESWSLGTLAGLLLAVGYLSLPARDRAKRPRTDLG